MLTLAQQYLIRNKSAAAHQLLTAPRVTLERFTDMKRTITLDEGNITYLHIAAAAAYKAAYERGDMEAASRYEMAIEDLKYEMQRTKK